MTQPYNALYGPPQAPVDNALYYDDTQGMPRQRPADPLRWAADYIGQNKDLPAPQFFMDPRALSVRNMLHSGLGTAANWLDGTRDPSTVGPAEMVAPLGLAGMGTGLANAMTRAAPDVRIGEALARQHPDAVPGGNLGYGRVAGADRVWVSGPDGQTPTTAATLQRGAGGAAITRRPQGMGRPQNDILADNAKGSAPGTVVNSIGERPYDVRRAEFEDAIRTGKYKLNEENEIDVPFQYKMTAPTEADAARMDSMRRGELPTKREQVDLSSLWAMQPSVDGSAVASILKHGPDGRNPATYDVPVAYRALDKSIWLKDGHHRTSAAAARGDPTTEMVVMGARPQASLPGLAANSTQQDDQGVMSILRRYGLADDSTDMMRLGGPGSFKVGEPSPVQKTVFAGTNSATADHAALAEAKELKAINERPEEIFRTTGWFQREDGVWRNEIDDSQSKLKVLVDKPGEHKLSDVLNHPDLFAAYPQLKDVRLVFSNMRDFSGQAVTSPMADFRSMQPWIRGGKTTRLVRINLNSIQNKDPKTARDIVLHEVQHAIQDVEGDLTQDVMNKSAFVPYKDRLYEREGFEAQGRADMSKSERRNKTPGIADILKKYGLAD